MRPSPDAIRHRNTARALFGLAAAVIVLAVVLFALDGSGRMEVSKSVYVLAGIVAAWTTVRGIRALRQAGRA